MIKNIRPVRFLLFTASGLLLGLVAQNASAQAPGWSRGQQNLALSYDDCVRRMPAALQNEGYRRDPNSGGNFVAGSKGVHTAVIVCSPAPDAKMLVQIVVASNGAGGGRERQCLQAQMEGPGASRCGGNAGGGGDTRWLYRDGGFSDMQVFHANGTATSESNRQATATWRIEGGEMVVRWWNGWTNRYTWNGSAQVSGVAIGPSGERHSITLTRQ
ncbi:MAG TPA: hypothetical protein VE863_08430 [Pyrinomonadaceae bacterium]|nr:hypothetical protein [Pyrinomonadaceae bacterium]